MDGTKSIILNAVGTANDVDNKMKAFLDYVAGKMSDDSYVRRVNMAIEKAKMDSALRRDYLIRMQNQLQSDKRARANGQNELAEAIHMLKGGKSEDELRNAGIDQDTIDLALTCL